ncbi:VaFE repeat-containing surface-anchored protein [Lactococcus lactis]
MSQKINTHSFIKRHKHLLYSGALLIALVGGGLAFNPHVFSPQTVYAVTNGSITLNQGIIMNTGAVESGNPEGRVYCIDEGTPLYSSGTSANLSDTGSGAAGVTWATLDQAQRKQVQTIGWLSFNNATTSAATDNNLYLAAQCLTWDVTTGHGLPDKSNNSFYNPTHFGEGSDQAWYAATPNTDAASINQDIDLLIGLYQKFLVLPQFDATSQTIHMGEVATFTDQHNQLSAYNQLTATNGLKASVSGNKLTVTPTQSGTGSISLSNGGISESDGTANSGGVHVWFTNNIDGTVGQNVIYSEAASEQKVEVTVKAIPSGALKIIKHDNDTGKLIPGSVFIGLNQAGEQVTKDADGKDLPEGGKFTTGKDGSVTVSNLMVDPDDKVGDKINTIVTLREVSVPAPYTLSNNLVSVVDRDGNVNKPSTDLPISLVAGTTAENPTGVTFSDTTQVQAIQVQKTARLEDKPVSDFPNVNYSLAGAIFTIKNETQKTTLGKLYTDDKGRADLSSLIKTGDAHQSASDYQALLNQLKTTEDTYSIQETQAPNGLACDWNGGKAQTFTLTYSEKDSELINPTTPDESNGHTDTPILVDSTLTKVDSETTSSQTQGSALLAGTIETLFYKVDVKDSTGKVIHKAGEPVKWSDGFSELPISITHGKKADDTYVSLQVTSSDNKVGVSHLPLTRLTSSKGYVWHETDAKGKSTAGFGYTANTQDFEVASGEGNDGTGNTTPQTTISGDDTNLTQSDHVLTVGLAFTKALGDKGSLTGENGAGFEVTPLDKQTKAILSGKNGQNAQATSGDSQDINGYTTAGLTTFKFAIGNYNIHQTVVPEGTKAIQDILVHFTPEPTENGAPSTYTLSVTWADGQNIYNKIFQADDFKDGNDNLINVNLGTVTDNKILPPAIATHATDSTDGDQRVGVGQVSVSDASTIENLPQGDYTEVTHWVDSSTGSALMVGGKPALVQKDFTSQGNGRDEVTTTLNFDSAQLQGKSLTAEEFVYPKGKGSGTPLVSETAYKNNPKQTVKVEQLSGSTQVESKTIEAKKDATYINDYKVSGFVLGNTYVVKVTQLWDKTKGQLISATGSVTFKATSSTMTAKVPVHLDSSTLAGHDFVTFEDLYVVENDKEILVHQMNDKNAISETVHVNLPTATPSPIQNTVNQVKNTVASSTGNLPTTGEKASWGAVVLGGILLGMVGVLKRKALVKVIRAFRNRFGK